MKFGVARKHGPDLIRYIPSLRRQNIDAYEIGFAFGPKIISKEEQAVAFENNIALSGHLPFWINFGNMASFEKNVKYLIDGIRLAELLNSTIVFHLGFYGEYNLSDICFNIKNCFAAAFEMQKLNNGFLGIETTGKQKAIGSINDIIRVINELNCDRVIPVIDWSHIYARSNGQEVNTKEKILNVLEYFEDNCRNRLRYFHGGSIEFKNGNEIKHISAKALQPSMPDIIDCLCKKGYDDSTIIIESPDSINDINWLKNLI